MLKAGFVSDTIRQRGVEGSMKDDQRSADKYNR
jgi:hypothetical protein